MRGAAVNKELSRTRRNGREGISQKRICAQNEKGEDKKPELSCVRTSLKNRHSSINSFLFNIFLMISEGIERYHTIG